MGALRLPEDYVPPTKPPAARPPEVRKAQLLRTYTSLLRSTPIILLFQHNNLTAQEWAAVRRELRLALAAVSANASSTSGAPSAEEITADVKLQVIRTRIFDVALKIVEFFNPATVEPTPIKKGSSKTAVYNHDLSKAAYTAIKEAAKNPEALADPDNAYGQLSPLFVGPLATLTFPAVSPAHLAAALSVLAPQAPAFPAPTRRKNPGYWEPEVQNALQKLLLVGGRIEGKVFDVEGVRWVGGIEGGLDSLRAQLVYLLQSAGLGLTSALEGAGKSLWLTMESRRSVLEEEAKPKEEHAAPEEKKE
jgi:large subunit ribosomal protein L10